VIQAEIAATVTIRTEYIRDRYIMSSQIKSILIRRDDNLGDCVVAIPAVREIKRNYPKARITLMVKPQHRPIFFGYCDDYLDPLPSKLLPRLQRKYDLIVDIEYAIPQNYRFKRIKKNQIIHVGVPDWSRPRHIFRSLLVSLKLHGLAVKFDPPKINLKPDAQIQAKKWIADHKINPNQLNVAIAPGSGFAQKRWSLSRFLTISKWLISQYDARIIILASSSELQLIKELNAKLKNKHSVLLHNKSIEIAAAILPYIDFLLGNDSGTAHVAASVGIPTITIFGPTSPSYWRPLNNKSVIVFDESASCPGGYDHAKECKKQKCLLGIKTENVKDAVNRIITRHLDHTTKSYLDQINITRHLRRRYSSQGIILSNLKTGHSCRIKKGWSIVRKVLDMVRKTNSFSRTLERFPREKELLAFLFMHRIIVPNALHANRN
jgi:ADP-heptose:LPS heptosyltransferase